MMGGCPVCQSPLIWQSDIDASEEEGTSLILSYWDCSESTCGSQLTITTVVEDEESAD